MAYIPRNVKEFASTRETSDEIAMAIYEIAPEGDEQRMWKDPDPAEVIDIEHRAWELTDADVDTLHWGVTTISRPVP